MKALKTVSALACLALLSTYSVNGFAKSGNGDSYSGPTLSGAAVSLTQDKQILNSQLVSVIRSCLVDGEKSLLSQVLLPFYGKELTQVKGDNGSQYLNTRISDRSDNSVDNAEEFFADGAASFRYYSSYTLPEITIKHKSGWRTYTYKLQPYATVTSFLNMYGTLNISIWTGYKNDGNVPSTTTQGTAEYNEAVRMLKEKYKERKLVIGNLPIFSAAVSRLDTFNPITGDYLKTELALKNLKMAYDRDSQDAYSQVFNANTEGKVAPTQFMAPNAEFADCVSDKLGRL